MNQLPLDHFLNYKYLSNLNISPSFKKGAFVVSKAHLEKNEYQHELYLIENFKQRRLTKLGKQTQFIFEDEKHILYPFERTKEEKKLKEEFNSIYYRINVDTKKKEKAYSFPFPCEIVEVISDELLLLKANLSRALLKLRNLSGEERQDHLKELKKEALYEEINQIPFYLNGPGFTANKYNFLFIYNIKKESLIQVNYGDMNVGDFKVDKKNEKIIYAASEKLEKLPLFHRVFAFDYKTITQQVIYDQALYSIRQIHLLEDDIICYASDMKELGINQNGSFYIIKDNDLHLLTKFNTSIGNSIGSDVRLGASKLAFVYNHKLYFTTTVDDHSELYSLDKFGKTERLYIADGSIDAFQIIDDVIIMNMLYKQRLQDLYIISLDKKAPKRLTNHNGKNLKDFYIAKPKEIVVRGESHHVKGYILLPKDYDQNKTYPAILNIHGGPKTVYGKVYYHEMQVWANLGYVVFFANPRGSDGKGDAFSDIRGKYGTIDYEDLMIFTDLVLKRVKNIDQNRLFVTGGSYGGFMTNWIVGQTNRFKAAVTQRSITNWISFYGTSDIGYYFASDQTDAHPEDNLKKLWDQSPLKYKNNIQTPLLFIHADKDYRCPIEQALQLYTYLKEKDVKTKLIWFKDENHDLSRSGKPQARIKRLNAITNWFNDHL